MLRKVCMDIFTFNMQPRLSNRCLVVTYLIFCIYICPSIQKEGQGGMVIKFSSQIECGLSILQQGQTDIHTKQKAERTYVILFPSMS